MRSLTIKKGETDSQVLTLGHWKIGTIFVPALADDQFRVEVLGSHDDVSFGPIDDGLAFYTRSTYSVRSFDPDVFAGIQFIKLSMSKSADKDLDFFVHIEDT